MNTVTAGNTVDTVEAQAFAPQVEAPKIDSKNLRDLDLLKDSIYMIDVSICLGRKRMGMDYSKMGLPEAAVTQLEQAYSKQDLKDNAAIGFGSMSIFETLEKAGNDLSALKNKFEAKYTIFVKPYRFLAEKNLVLAQEDAECGLNFIKARRDQLLYEGIEKGKKKIPAIIEQYDEDKRLFLERCEYMLTRAGIKGEDLERSLVLFEEKFPTWEEVEENFQVTISWGGRTPGIVEQAKYEAELRQALNEREQADAEQKRIQMERSLQVETMRAMREAAGQAMVEAREKVFGLIAKNLEALRSLSLTGAIHPKTRENIAENLRNLELLLNFDQSESLRELVDQLKVTQANAHHRGESLAQELDQLEQALEQQTSAAAWSVSSLDAEIHALSLRIDEFVTEVESSDNSQFVVQKFTEIQDLQNRVVSLTAILEHKSKDLQARLNKAQAAVQGGLIASAPKVELEEVVTAEPQDAAWDQDAGF